MTSSPLMPPRVLGSRLQSSLAEKAEKIVDCLGGSFRIMHVEPANGGPIDGDATVGLVGCLAGFEAMMHLQRGSVRPFRIAYVGAELDPQRQLVLVGSGVHAIAFDPVTRLEIAELITGAHAETLALRRSLARSRAVDDAEFRRDSGAELERLVGQYDLTHQRARVLHGVLAGLTNGQIAGNMNVSVSMVKKSLAWLYDHFGVRSRHLLRAKLGAGERRAEASRSSTSSGRLHDNSESSSIAS